jgi:hypothetical protein
MTRLEVIEKMLNLGLIDIDQAKEMEDLTPDGNESDLMEEDSMQEDSLEEDTLDPGNELGL